MSIYYIEIIYIINYILKFIIYILIIYNIRYQFFFCISISIDVYFANFLYFIFIIFFIYDFHTLSLSCDKI